MSSFLQIPLKKTQSVDFVKPLSSYIKNTFSNEILNENKDSLAELNQLRSNAVVKSLDKHETSLETLERYYDQLCTMEAKLSITEDQIRISFTWYDCFDKGSIFSSTKTTLSSGAYERFCVLFNTGALLSQLGATQNQSSDDGLKTAAKYFQRSAGIFTSLKDNVYAVLQTLPTPDLSVNCLTALVAINLAQAQDCFYLKATTDNMKDALIAKIAVQASDFYQEAVRAVTNYEVKGLWEKDWIPFLQCKHAYFTSAAEYHQSIVNGAAGAYGEQVGRLQKADKFIKDALKFGGDNPPARVKTMSGAITKLLTTSKKDNELIYLEPVPSPDSLQAIGRASLSKALPVSSPMSANFVDLFNKLVPMEVHKAMTVYDSSKAAILNQEIGKLREATQFMNGILASLNLPAAIEDLTGNSVPPSLLEKAQQLKDKGGLNAIDTAMQNLPDLLQRNQEIIDETLRMLDNEQNEDKQMRDHFKERWSRTPSDKLTQQLREEGIKYKGILSNATSADSVVKEKYNTHRRGMEILSKSESEIAASLPKGDAVAASGAGSQHIRELQDLMLQVEQTKTQRNKLEEEFKGATVDMQSKFLQALAAEGFLDSEKHINTNLDELYGPLRTEVAEILENQNTLIEKIQEANNGFNEAKQGHVGQRDQLLKDLAAAFDAYIELSANLQEGTKFYNDLTNIMLKFQSKVNDFVFARKTEKDDLSKDLQQQATKGTAAPPPTVPDYQAPQRQPPPQRPPLPRPQAPVPTPQQQPPPAQSAQAPPQQPTPVPRPRPNAGPTGAPPQSPSSMPYPVAPNFIPQPGIYAQPGGYYVPPQPHVPGYAPNTGFPPQYGQVPQYPPQQQQPGQYPQQAYGQPPYYGQGQPPMGYQGYGYQQ